jgi:hypothetical protein
VLAIAGLGTFLSAIAGGWVAFRINSGKTILSNVFMSVMVVIETTWILKTFKAESPLWFDVLAALSLIIGILLGCHLVYLRKIIFQI